MASIRRIAPFAVAFALAALGAGCSGDTTTVETSTQTSIVIRSDTLVASRGCGTADGQVYKYAVSLTPPSDSKQLPVSALFDCYADAAFGGLVASAGNQPFTLKIAAFQATDFKAREGAILDAVDRAGANDLDNAATWKTTCKATQQASVTVLAICPDPLR